jgi:predicted O-methyltransferase YrrM
VGELAFIAHGQKSDAAYAPSFEFDEPLLIERQAAIHDEVAPIDGWLEPVDSLKLYELAYLAEGPFLEIGTYRGKSATLIATAFRDAGRRPRFYSLDIAGDDLERARATLAARGLGSYVTVVHGSVAAFFRALPDFAPRFVFLDGDHSREGVGRDLAALEPRVPVGALLLFHDYRNPRNEDPADKLYGVPAAVHASWVVRDCEFAGSFGCTALYRRRKGQYGQDDGTSGQPPRLELIALDRLRVRALIEVARPLKRWLRRSLVRLR